MEKSRSPKLKKRKLRGNEKQKRQTLNKILNGSSKPKTIPNTHEEGKYCPRINLKNKVQGYVPL